jgi:hypothetical protein
LYSFASDGGPLTSGVKRNGDSPVNIPTTIPALAAVVVIGWGVYLLVRISRMPPERPGVGDDSKSMKKEVKEEEQPDGMGGIAAVILCVALLAFLIIVPAREGASSGGKFYLVAVGLSGLGWGLRQIRLARAQDKRDAEAAKEKNGEKGA